MPTYYNAAEEMLILIDETPFTVFVIIL